MQGALKAVIVTVIPAVTFALGAAPASAVSATSSYSVTPAAAVETLSTSQSLLTADALDDDLALSKIPGQDDFGSIPHGFDVDAAIEQAESEIGTSRPTGWSQPGECIMSAKRWIQAGGGVWTGSGDPVSTYEGALRLTLRNVEPGDIIQYEHLLYPTSWIAGVHTVLVTEVHDDGTLTIIESNNPGGSGLVSKNEHWTPAPPAGFQAVVWRF